MTSAYFGKELQLYDSSASGKLTFSLEEQLSQIYQGAKKEWCPESETMPVQQQANTRDCGVYSIAYAYHAALGDDLTELHFDPVQMRRHLIHCFTSEEFSPFPVKEGQPSRRCIEKDIFIPLYCICSMPESYDKEMIQCDLCEQWYHFRCVKIRKDPGNWTCPRCT